MISWGCHLSAKLSFKIEGIENCISIILDDILHLSNSPNSRPIRSFHYKQCGNVKNLTFPHCFLIGLGRISVNFLHFKNSFLSITYSPFFILKLCRPLNSGPVEFAKCSMSSKIIEYYLCHWILYLAWGKVCLDFFFSWFFYDFKFFSNYFDTRVRSRYNQTLKKNFNHWKIFLKNTRKKILLKNFSSRQIKNSKT